MKSFANNPLVSVIIPNYNHAPFLNQRIESVLNQTFTDFEVIILDDCSTDNSRDVIETYRDNPKISQIVLNKTNSGSTFIQWNKGVNLAKGKYIWLAESDDAAEPDLLKELVAILENNQSVGIAKCNSQVIDQDGNKEYIHEDISHYQRNYSCIINGRKECLEQLKNNAGFVNASGIIFRKDLYLKIGGADESYRISGDRLTWARILLHSDLYGIEQPLNLMRQTHSETARAKYMARKKGIFFLEKFRIAEYLLKQLKPDFNTTISILNTQISEWTKASLDLKNNRISIKHHLSIYCILLRTHWICFFVIPIKFISRLGFVISKKVKK